MKTFCGNPFCRICAILLTNQPTDKWTDLAEVITSFQTNLVSQDFRELDYAVWSPLYFKTGPQLLQLLKRIAGGECPTTTIRWIPRVELIKAIILLLGGLNNWSKNWNPNVSATSPMQKMQFFERRLNFMLLWFRLWQKQHHHFYIFVFSKNKMPKWPLPLKLWLTLPGFY